MVKIQCVQWEFYMILMSRNRVNFSVFCIFSAQVGEQADLNKPAEKVITKETIQKVRIQVTLRRKTYQAT